MNKVSTKEKAAFSATQISGVNLAVPNRSANCAITVEISALSNPDVILEARRSPSS